ncbi:3-hydroxyacyl-CoA dehydrogenase NAD-binding domain-containing protein [Streptomyces sp. ActVer]|uniref:3-hydroxyacyl-CoA dehydrogenase NAD-binding domain-containing protein n=1 Tax=Streptomyces sp. ActVer TaxID=3014558 RepID=UPI0022B3DDA2|nr:3-hydroxyacyl-CoA dehydrogenase NAD-binding domain-containing protein [Streptomyces sp. ActVer]MCZ4507620.1 3-hydroxyacyl-CoA dehydrogenase NAD-binding domain-containing protein [Streptomyces sp. ActVer]
MTTDKTTDETTDKTSQHIRYEHDRYGIVTLTLDLPGSPNVMNTDYRTAMATAVDRLEAERDDITGVVVTSAKQTFFAGGDLDALISVTPDNAHAFAAELAAIKDQLRRLETLGRPVAAAVNGSALGCGLEIALACHHRVCLDDPALRLGFPEATLGLLPGAGGVTRTVRMLGVQAALPLLTEGRRLRPGQAQDVGWVHELAADHDELLDKARAWVLANPGAVQPWDTPGHQVPDLKPLDPASYDLLAVAPAVLRKKTHGCYPAPEKILAAAVEGALLDFDTALQVESRYLLELVTGQVAKNLIGTFWFQLGELKAGRSRPSGHAPYRTRKVGVLGAGMMGTGIAQVSALAGIDVVLKDVTAEAAERGRARIAEALGERHATALDRITPTGDDADLAGCDLVIEAVFEDHRLKNTVLAAAETAALPDAVIASNTSTLPITGLADAVPDPDRFVGLHFFSPVARMPLVEIIRSEGTSDATLARAFDYVLQIDKTPIVVNDSRGFYTTRVFGTYITEGAALVAEGVHPALVENMAKKAGMAVGPLAVLDEVTLTLPLQARDQAEPGVPYADPAYQLLDTLARELGRTGKADGAGFYDYPADGSPKTLWPGLAERWTTPDDAGVPEQDIHDRLLFVQALETVRILDQGVLTSVADANIGSVYGIGFAPWTGGTLQLINAYGPQAFVARADHLADAYGDRFRPPAVLRERAGRGERF